MRAGGILLPISSLPSNYGIGTFGKSAYRFLDQLQESGQKYWQILPLGATGYGDSPYQSFSTYAGNPYYIDLDILIQEGILNEDDTLGYDVGDNEQYIDYEKIYLSRYKILKKAFERQNLEQNEFYQSFRHKNEFWLKDYSLYMAVKDHFDGIMWQDWSEGIKLRTPVSMEYYSDLLKNEIEFYTYIQYLFDKQWMDLKSYANQKGIKIIGDIPIYVALDSADTWSNSDLFLFDEQKSPTEVAGCPPDAFSATGQLWGNPIYDWDNHENTGFLWWTTRIEYCFKLYDVVRIDHFRGFDEYYSIPYGHKTAEHGSWKKGPGYDLFLKLQERLGNLDIIAEDLGYVTDSVKELLKKTGYPGMKVLQFAFDSREASNYLPHHYDKNCVVYTGTHDNDTLLGWYYSINKEDKLVAKRYLGIQEDLPEVQDENGISFDLIQKGKEDKIASEYCDRIIRMAYSSVADLVIIPIQDFLGMGSEARINVPSTIGTNWKWRLLEKDITREVIDYMAELTKIYER